jgi:ubiquitin-protein ligase
MSAVRLRRLQADYQKLQDLVQRHPRIQLIQADGDPPERYQVQYRLRSLQQKDDELVEATTHLVEIALPRNYPRVPPQCRMLTPIFHPNIAPHAICIGDHWSAGEPLASIVVRIGELIAYQSYNTKSPLNGEAARWVAENVDELPLDPVSLLPEDAAPAPPRPAPPTPQSIQFPCPQCSAQLRIPTEHAGKRIRCPRCQATAAAPAGPGP